MSIATYGTSSAGTGGTFPGASSTSLQGILGAYAHQLSGLTPAQFFADYHITSTDQGVYLTNGALNANAVYLAYYSSLNQNERQNIQEQMALAGLMPTSDATGVDNSASRDAFKALLGRTFSMGSNPFTYLEQNASGTNAIQSEISGTLSKAQEQLTGPVTATLTNPNTLAADITNAFDQALGYAPDQAQIQSFINQIQGQETNYAAAPRTEAKEMIAKAQGEESALNRLGPEGIDSVVRAYQAAVNGTGLAGAGTTAGPVTGTAPLQREGFATPGTETPPGTAYRYDAQGNQVGMNTQPTPKTTYKATHEGLIGQVISRFTPGGVANQGDYMSTPTTAYTRQQQIVPPRPAGSANSVPVHGGLYALSGPEWQKAQSLYAPAKKYDTAGNAPESVQLGAFTALLQDAYDSNGGSWSKAVESLAQGTPLGAPKGTNLSSFATNLANQVNAQIESLQGQVNNQDVTVKVQAPDVTGAYSAEAANAAKQADPVGYYAANYASWGEELNQMLAGAPLMYQQGTSDTFSGPVSSAVAGTNAGK